MSTYCESPDEVREMITNIKNKYYPDLCKAEVTITSLMAHARRNEKGEITGPSLTLHGHPAIAIVSVTNHKNRVAGLTDVIIEFDGDIWNDFSLEDQSAIVDHELFHIDLKKDEDGEFQSDDSGRPKVRLKPHDWQLGGFGEIAKRHGSASQEVQQLKTVVSQYGIGVS